METILEKGLGVENKGKQTSSTEFNTEFRKKQDPLKIGLSCRVVYYKDIQKKKSFLFFKFSQNKIERCTNKKKMKNKKYRNLKIFLS